MKRWAMRIGVGVGVVFVGLIAVACLAGALYEAPLRIPADLAGNYVDAQGLALRVQQQGSGRDVLLIHGSPGSLEDFSTVTKALGGSFRVTSYDRPGNGCSADSGRYDLAHNAEIAAALIDKLGLTRVIVVGHSYGGSTALALALGKPERVSAYVVIDSAAYRRIRVDPPLYRVLSLPLLGVGLARINPESSTQQRIEDGLNTVFAPRTPPPGFVALRQRIWSQPKVSHALASESVHYDDALELQAPHYPEIRAPVYILAQRDEAPRRETAARLQRDIPGAQLELVERTGHFIQFERPDAVVATIQRAAAER